MANKKPPARIRYEQKHPTVSFRLDLDTKKRLKNALEGQSFANFIKEALGVKEKEVKDLKAERQKAYRQGYTAAEIKFKVTFPCSKCGKFITVDDEEIRQITKKGMKDLGVAHVNCHAS